jgi:hypothetical protein
MRLTSRVTSFFVATSLKTFSRFLTLSCVRPELIALRRRLKMTPKTPAISAPAAQILTFQLARKPTSFTLTVQFPSLLVHLSVAVGTQRHTRSSNLVQYSIPAPAAFEPIVGAVLAVLLRVWNNVMELQARRVILITSKTPQTGLVRPPPLVSVSVRPLGALLYCFPVAPVVSGAVLLVLRSTNFWILVRQTEPPTWRLSATCRCASGWPSRAPGSGSAWPREIPSSHRPPRQTARPRSWPKCA